MGRGLLDEIERLFSSDNPRDRALGTYGKIAVEIGSALIVAAVLVGLGYGVAITLFRFEPPVGLLGLLSVVAAVTAYLGNKVYCNIIWRPS